MKLSISLPEMMVCCSAFLNRPVSFVLTRKSHNYFEITHKVPFAWLLSITQCSCSIEKKANNTCLFKCHVGSHAFLEIIWNVLGVCGQRIRMFVQLLTTRFNYLCDLALKRISLGEKKLLTYYFLMLMVKNSVDTCERGMSS